MTAPWCRAPADVCRIDAEYVAPSVRVIPVPTVGAVLLVFTITLARLVAYAINDRDRWRRFLFLVFLALVVAAGWWLLADGGIHALVHDFGRT
jgi:hypothetical protein